MKIGFIIFDGMTSLDFIGAYDPLTRLKTMGFQPELEWEICSFHTPVHDAAGLLFTPTLSGRDLSGFDLIVVPGGKSVRDLVQSEPFIQWLRSAEACPLKTSVCTGSLLLGAAGFLEGKTATSHPNALEQLEVYAQEALPQRLVESAGVITAGGVTAGIDLGLYLVEKIAGQDVRQKIQAQMDYTSETPLLSITKDVSASQQPRSASLARRTAETQIDVALNLDGKGEHAIDTGIGFLDHMLTHLAVHGLFDLRLKASGDLHVDVHHTVEDVALALGAAFAQALGDRSGIVRMASAYAPMDETLAFVAVDLSGRPYAVIEGQWHSPSVGGIPVSLFPHFFESFAFAGRLNLHARLLAGKDDHHQAEGLFKALARALDAAARIDPRRAGGIPSTKGTLST